MGGRGGEDPRGGWIGMRQGRAFMARRAYILLCIDVRWCDELIKQVLLSEPCRSKPGLQSCSLDAGLRLKIDGGFPFSANRSLVGVV